MIIRADRQRLGGILLAVLAAIAMPARADLLAESTFDAGSEGWRVTWDADADTSGWLPFGGNPGGYMFGTDRATGVAWYFDSPGGLLDAFAHAYEGSLSFDLYAVGRGLPVDQNISDVVLFGRDASGFPITLHYGLAQDPASRWTSYAVPLSPLAGWKAVEGVSDYNILRELLLDTLPDATPGQMQQVLSSVERLVIRGEYYNLEDQGGLDNVRLHGPALPVADAGSTGCLLVASLGALAGLRRLALAHAAAHAPAGKTASAG
jgi:hypothetical protein